jgi:cytochrome c oxidase subunit II
MVLVGVAVGAALALVAWLIPWLPDQGAEEAGGIDNSYWLVTIICVFIFALVASVSVYAVWKFRVAPDDEDDGSPIHGHTGLEVAWTIVPTILVTAISVYSGVVLTQVEDIPADHRIVEVTSQQFAWTFTYPDEQLTTGELVLPVGEPVEFRLQARDVIHSFWVPEWRLKQDAVPGITTRLVITPSKTGTYTVVCTELCGLGHATMRARATVMNQQDFRAWLAERRREAAAAGANQGKSLFTSLGCGSCHVLQDAGSQGEVGPNLDNVLADADEEFVRQSIVTPDAEIAQGFQPGVMPQTYGEQLSEQQLNALVEYLLEAGGGGG